MVVEQQQQRRLEVEVVGAMQVVLQGVQVVVGILVGFCEQKVPGPLEV